MRELTVGGGEPFFEGFDTRELGMDYAAIKRREEDELTAKLAHLRKHCIGNFKTNIRCHCPAYITDHATERDPDRHVSLSEVRMGPPPSLREQVEAFRPHHRYWCDACGLMYKASVIEGVRGWVPLERRSTFAK